MGRDPVDRVDNRLFGRNAGRPGATGRARGRRAPRPHARVHRPPALASVPDDKRPQGQERPVDRLGPEAGKGPEAGEFGARPSKRAVPGPSAGGRRLALLIRKAAPQGLQRQAGLASGRRDRAPERLRRSGPAERRRRADSAQARRRGRPGAEEGFCCGATERGGARGPSRSDGAGLLGIFTADPRKIAFGAATRAIP